MKSSTQKLEIVFKYDGVDGEVILSIVIDILEKFGLQKKLYLHDAPISKERLIKKIKEKGGWPTGISSCELEFRYGVVGNRAQSFFMIKEKKAGVVSDWQAWVDPFSGMDQFIQAWVADIDYDYWQNAYDPIQFTSVKREYLHLPMKSNGLPYPLEKQIVDTSKNPGRWTFNFGYIEAVASTMWLGENFWDYVGHERKKKLFKESRIRTETHDNKIIKLIAADECFIDESTADSQNRLRRILYEKD